MIAAGIFVDSDTAFRAWLRDLFDFLLRQLLVFDMLFVSLHPLFVRGTGLTLVHKYLAAEAVAVLALLAGEDVAVDH